MSILRKYGVATTVDFELFEVDGVDFRVDAVAASGDILVMKDEGAEANCANLFVDEGTGYSLALTAAELTAARVVIYLIDSATKVWLDRTVIIETYGNASAQHAFDLDTATQDVNVASEDNIDFGATKKASINTECDTALTDYDPPSRAELTTDKDSIITEISKVSGDVNVVSGDVVSVLADTNELQTDWVDSGRLDALLDAIPTTAMRGTDSAALASVCTEARLAELDAANLPATTDRTETAAGVISGDTAAIAALNDISSGDVLTQVNAALDTAIPELSQGIPTATPTIRTGLMFPYMALRNKSTTTASEYGVYNDAGTKIAKAVLSDDGTTFTHDEMISGV